MTVSQGTLEAFCLRQFARIQNARASRGELLDAATVTAGVAYLLERNVEECGVDEAQRQDILATLDHAIRILTWLREHGQDVSESVVADHAMTACGAVLRALWLTRNPRRLALVS